MGVWEAIVSRLVQANLGDVCECALCAETRNNRCSKLMGSDGLLKSMLVASASDQKGGQCNVGKYWCGLVKSVDRLPRSGSAGWFALA